MSRARAPNPLDAEQAPQAALHSGGNIGTKYFKRSITQRKAVPPLKIPGQSWRCATAWEFGELKVIRIFMVLVRYEEDKRELGQSAAVGSPSV